MFKIEFGDIERTAADLATAQSQVEQLRQQGYLGRAYLYEKKSDTCWSLRERICLR